MPHKQEEVYSPIPYTIIYGIYAQIYKSIKEKIKLKKWKYVVKDMVYSDLLHKQKGFFIMMLTNVGFDFM